MRHTYFHHSRDRNIKRLLAAFFVTALFTLVEVVGGLISGSLALLADAGHMLTDSAALLMALLAIQFAKSKPNARQTFGLLRLTTLAAFLNAITMLIIIVSITWEAINRFSHPQPITGGLMLGMAVFGLLANMLSFLLLHHSSEKNNLNVRAAMLHIIGDLLGSIGAIGAAIIILFTNWMPIDPILSLLVSMLVLFSAWSLLRESFHELLEGAPISFDTNKMKMDLKQNIDEVQDVHHVHVWQVGEEPMLTLHVQVIPPSDHDELLRIIHHYLYQYYQIEHATVQMEFQPCVRPDCKLGSRCTKILPHHGENAHNH